MTDDMVSREIEFTPQVELSDKYINVAKRMVVRGMIQDRILPVIVEIEGRKVIGRGLQMSVAGFGTVLEYYAAEAVERELGLPSSEKG